MKHKPCKYVWNNTWQYPSEQGIWCREKFMDKVILSRCTLGNYVLSLNKTFTFEDNDNFDGVLLEMYNFAIYDRLNGSPIFHCSLENGMQFDTDDIDLAERTAEYIWKQTLFYEELKWAPKRTFGGTRWERVHWGIRG